MGRERGSDRFFFFTEEGELIHEPAHSWCVPDDGQEAEELAAEIPDYHRGPEVEDRQHERCDGGDRLAADASDTTADATGVVNAATADSAEAVAAAASERDGERTAAEIASGEADADATSPPSVVSERQPSAGEGADVPAVMGAVTVTLPDWLIDGARSRARSLWVPMMATSVFFTQAKVSEKLGKGELKELASSAGGLVGVGGEILSGRRQRVSHMCPSSLAKWQGCLSLIGDGSVHDRPRVSETALSEGTPPV
eukprot:scaffold18957_cov139-Isochrysis_galbana.AAC.1